MYNYDGTEVLASYNDEDIYLFDAISPQPGDFAHKYEGHRNNATGIYYCLVHSTRIKWKFALIIFHIS